MTPGHHGLSVPTDSWVDVFKVLNSSTPSVGFFHGVPLIPSNSGWESQSIQDVKISILNGKDLQRAWSIFCSSVSCN